MAMHDVIWCGSLEAWVRLFKRYPWCGIRIPAAYVTSLRPRPRGCNVLSVSLLSGKSVISNLEALTAPTLDKKDTIGRIIAGRRATRVGSAWHSKVFARAV